jgi:hypothetical protein
VSSVQCVYLFDQRKSFPISTGDQPAPIQPKSLNMLSFHLFGLPDYQFVKTVLGRSDNLLIQRSYERVERRIMKGSNTQSRCLIHKSS